MANKLHQVQKEKYQLSIDLQNSKNQVKQLQVKIKEFDVLKKTFDDEKSLHLERIKMLSNTNAKLSKQCKEYESKTNSLQKEIQSKTQRLEIFRNYK